MAQTVVVTGASGFVGLPLCSLLVRAGTDVRAAVRHESPALAELAGGLQQVVVGGLGKDTDWSAALEGAETVVHLAARVHVGARAGDAALFRQVNIDATLRLAQCAARARVRRLVFVSSVKAGQADDDPYSQSKAEAERLLGETSRNLGLECVILRPPLVYGPRVRANFLRLMRLVDSGIPLPLASIANQRSLLFVGNLADAIRLCIAHPNASTQTFAVTDGEDVSTPDLVARIARALGRPARLFPFPVALLRLAGGLTGQKQSIDRLAGNLTIDSEPIRAALGWRAPYTLEQGLAQTAAWYLAHRDGIRRARR